MYSGITFHTKKPLCLCGEQGLDVSVQQVSRIALRFIQATQQIIRD